MGKGKKTTKRKQTFSVKGLPVKETKPLTGGHGGGGGAGKANLQDLSFTKYS